MRRSKKHAANEAEINIIPLLDVLLVLVAVLLLLTPFMAKSINVELPKATSGQVMTQESFIALEIKADGSVWHENKMITDWEPLFSKIKVSTAARVYADKGAAFVAVTQVLDKLAANGLHNIQFAVKE